MTTSYPAPNPPAPFGGVPKHHSGQTNAPVELVVIHSAVMPCRRGMASVLARWNREGTTGGSWHYSTDPYETFQCSWDRYVCHAAPPNAHKIHIEMADHPVPVPAGRTKRALVELRKSWRWARKEQRMMLHRTARLTAELCLANGLPPYYRTAAQVRAGAKGWTTHAQVTNAWGQSTHWDPGWWPRRRFGALVLRYANELVEEVNT